MDDLKATLRHRIHYLLSVEAGEQRANASYPEIDALLDDLPLAEAAQGAAPEPHRDYAGRTCTTGLLHDHSEGAAPRAEGLDVRRTIQEWWDALAAMDHDAGIQLAKPVYRDAAFDSLAARLSRPSDERVPEGSHRDSNGQPSGPIGVPA